MTQTIFHMFDELLGNAIVLQTIVELLDDGLNDEDVGTLIMTAHVIDLADLAAVSHHIDSLAMVLHIQPVTDLHAVAVHRELLVMLDVVDHQRNQLLRELVGAVVIGAASDVDGHTIGIMKRLHKIVGAGLRRRVRAVGIDRRSLHEIALLTSLGLDVFITSRIVLIT